LIGLTKAKEAMAKKQRKKAIPTETAADPYRECVVGELAKLDLAIGELDANIDGAVTARDQLVIVRSCLKDGLLNRPTQVACSFKEPEIELGDDNEVTLTFEKNDG